VEGIPPSVKLPGHPSGAGGLLEWRETPYREWWARVAWTHMRPGFRGGLEPRESWFPRDRVEPIPGEDYSAVPRTYAQPVNPPR